ncbi:CLIP domain-containing serine protease B9-like [Chironomus tepperi]|uniref:CLIP domain-containing serine protease B9-like n=1 Tax=Chironomus tepperi TaxID=113505 RepID=UPI00391EEEE9
MLKYFVILFLHQFVYGNPIDEPPVTFQNAGQLESPWMVLIQIEDLVCGGSLIHGKYIVTAAHCFKYIKPEDRKNEKILKKSIKIKLGEWKTNMDPDCDDDSDEQICDPVVIIAPISIYVHHAYTVANYKHEHDIAIVKLAWPPRPTGLIQSIKLPDKRTCRDTANDEIWTVTAFGQLPDRSFTTIKKKIDLNMISTRECINLIKRGEKTIFDEKNYICGTGTRGESTCIGDSGSGATTKSRNVPILQGIVSFGTSDCGKRGVPSGLLKVACYIDWINTAINALKDADSTENDVTSETIETTETTETPETPKNDDDGGWRGGAEPEYRFRAQHVRPPSRY